MKQEEPTKIGSSANLLLSLTGEMESLSTTSGTRRFPENLGKHSPRTVTYRNLSSVQSQKIWSKFLAQQEQQARLASPLPVA